MLLLNLLPKPYHLLVNYLLGFSENGHAKLCSRLWHLSILFSKVTANKTFFLDQPIDPGIKHLKFSGHTLNPFLICWNTLVNYRSRSCAYMEIF